VGLADPVASGVVARLDRPSGNTTGFANVEATLGGKWLELLSEIAPGLKRTAIMFNPDIVTASTFMPSLETAARSLKVVPTTTPVHSDAEIETAIIALGHEPRGGLIVIDIFMLAHRASIISAAARNNVPAVYWASEFARDGGLLSYGFDQVDNFRRAASYVDRILRGAKPADLPVQLPTKFEMVVKPVTMMSGCRPANSCASARIRSSPAQRKVHPHVAAIGPPQARKRLRERGDPRFHQGIVFVARLEDADAPHPLSLLRPRRQRQRRRACQACDELPASHSITSSAVTSSVCGTVSPSALAVLRLITSSNLVGS
jgi:hypothetical protein